MSVRGVSDGGVSFSISNAARLLTICLSGQIKRARLYWPVSLVLLGIIRNVLIEHLPLARYTAEAEGHAAIGVIHRQGGA